MDENYDKGYAWIWWYCSNCSCFSESALENVYIWQIYDEQGMNDQHTLIFMTLWICVFIHFRIEQILHNIFCYLFICEWVT